MQILVHEGDIPDIFVSKQYDVCAIDTEANGLNIFRDRMLLCQIYFGGDVVHLIRFGNDDYNSPNLKKLLMNKNLHKVFHFARFDVSMIYVSLGVLCENIYCTRTASKIVRTSSSSHSLRELINLFIGKRISKTEQKSDWSINILTESQKNYAANDVFFLIEIKKRLDKMASNFGRENIIKICNSFLPQLVYLDVKHWEYEYLFNH